MRLPDAIASSIRDIRQRKGRSALTMLGIVIGIGSVIVVMSLGASAQAYILGQVQSFGSDLISINPGAPTAGGGPPAAVQGIVVKTLVQRDVDALEREPSILEVAGRVSGQSRAIYGNTDISVLWNALPPSIFEMMGLEFESGRAYTESDERAYNRVIVLGAEVAEDLFGGVEPVGKQIRLKDMTFTVVGVLAPKGAGVFSMDQYAMIPLTVGQKQLLGIDYFHELNAQVDPSYDAAFVKGRVISVLRQNHRITDPDKDDFEVVSMQEALNILGDVTSVLTIFLSSIAAISLIVGGIGIMNIMLVTVTERTREIGLRKAVGATDGDILVQFLVESAMLTTTGGAIGIMGGAMLTLLVYLGVTYGAGIEWPFLLPLSAVLIAVSVSMGIGILFGVYPARKAARKNPIDALRYE
jgi:putative ABC transport system permease protein